MLFGEYFFEGEEDRSFVQKKNDKQKKDNFCSIVQPNGPWTPLGPPGRGPPAIKSPWLPRESKVLLFGSLQIWFEF